VLFGYPPPLPFNIAGVVVAGRPLRVNLLRFQRQGRHLVERGRVMWRRSLWASYSGSKVHLCPAPSPGLRSSAQQTTYLSPAVASVASKDRQRPAIFDGSVWKCPTRLR